MNYVKFAHTLLRDEQQDIRAARTQNLGVELRAMFRRVTKKFGLSQNELSQLLSKEMGLSPRTTLNDVSGVLNGKWTSAGRALDYYNVSVDILSYSLPFVTTLLGHEPRGSSQRMVGYSIASALEDSKAYGGKGGKLDRKLLRSQLRERLAR